mmetsp:Transcript_71701/g.153262  ORF Transcript_71701/g.153262 Transcript_71701/m.153262 type:complete len:236 (-) Transcript_71701:141-848(-)
MLAHEHHLSPGVAQWVDAGGVFAVPLHHPDDVLPLLPPTIPDQEVDDAHKVEQLRLPCRPKPATVIFFQIFPTPPQRHCSGHVRLSGVVHSDEDGVVHNAKGLEQGGIALMGRAEFSKLFMFESQALPGSDPVLVLTYAFPLLLLPLEGGALDVIGLTDGISRIEHRGHDGEVLGPHPGELYAVEALVANKEGASLPHVTLVGRQHPEEERSLLRRNGLDDELLVRREEEELAGL